MPAAGEDPAGASFESLMDFAARAADPSLMEAADAIAVEVGGEFARREIPFVLMKGPAVARLLYRPGEQRRYMDVDLLVGPGASDRAAEALSELGFVNITAGAGVDDFTGAVPADTWVRARDLPVDLHTRFPGAAAPAEVAWPHLTENLQAITLGPLELPVFGRAGLALHLAVHVTQHGPHDVKAIGDLKRGIERWPLADWQAAAALAGQIEVVKPFAAGLRLVPSGAELAQALELPGTADVAWDIERGWKRPRGTFHLAALGGAHTPREAAAVLRRALLPRREWIVREYPWAARNGATLVGGYVRHALRLPRWAAAAWDYRRRMRRAR